MKNIYIDADSVLYRASYLACGDRDLAEAEAIAGLGKGIYTIATKVGGIPEQPDITYQNEQEIEAENEAEALKEYNNTFDNEYWVGEVLGFSSTEEEISLETAEVSSQLEDMKRIFHSMTADIVREVIADANTKGYKVNPNPFYVITVKGKHEVCKSLADNFRYTVMEEVADPNVKGYKANRKGMEVPEGLNDIYEYVFNLEATICESGVEADDVCVYYGRQGHIVCALDKDVLGSLEYAYNYDKQKWSEKSPIEIAMFPFLQTIMGDSSDGLRGVYRVGAKGAEKALAEVLYPSDYTLWAAVVKVYAMKDQTMEEAIATMRCVRMDQWTPEEGLVLWTPPKKGRLTEPTHNTDPDAPKWRYIDTKEEIR